jgi:hypothetical protein
MTKQKQRQSKIDRQAELVRRTNLWREAEASELRAIVDEHHRDDADATMLVLAFTIKALRGNLNELKTAIDRALAGGGCIRWQRYGPYREQRREEIIRRAQGQTN